MIPLCHPRRRVDRRPLQLRCWAAWLAVVENNFCVKAQRSRNMTFFVRPSDCAFNSICLSTRDSYLIFCETYTFFYVVWTAVVWPFLFLQFICTSRSTIAILAQGRTFTRICSSTCERPSISFFSSYMLLFVYRWPFYSVYDTTVDSYDSNMQQNYCVWGMTYFAFCPASGIRSESTFVVCAKTQECNVRRHPMRNWRS